MWETANDGAVSLSWNRIVKARITFSFSDAKILPLRARKL
jgi:hypothetical protein